MLNKTEFINKIAEENGMSKASVHQAVNIVLDGIVKTMVDDGGVNFTGFGQFYVKDVEEKEARNPINGETIVVPEHGQAKFKFGKTVKDAVR